MATANNEFQFLDVERADPPKRDMQRRRNEFVEIYDPFTQSSAESQSQRCLSRLGGSARSTSRNWNSLLAVAINLISN